MHIFIFIETYLFKSLSITFNLQSAAKFQN
jgi:hypothetical protein